MPILQHWNSGHPQLQPDQPEHPEHDADQRDDAVRPRRHEGEDVHSAGQDWWAQVSAIAEKVKNEEIKINTQINLWESIYEDSTVAE